MSVPDDFALDELAQHLAHALHRPAGASGEHLDAQAVDQRGERDGQLLGVGVDEHALLLALPDGADPIDQERFLDSGTTLAAFLPDFEVRFTPRSEKYQEVIENSMAVLPDVLSISATP